MVMPTTRPGTGSDPDLMVDINTTPLIDVMLVLLIMLIVTIPIQLHAVSLDLPKGVSPPQAPPQVIKVDIAADGTTRWNGSVVRSDAELDQLMRGVSAQQLQPEIHLHPDRQAPYRSVALLMAQAQRDGVTRLGLVSGADKGP